MTQRCERHDLDKVQVASEFRQDMRGEVAIAVFYECPQCTKEIGDSLDRENEFYRQWTKDNPGRNPMEPAGPDPDDVGDCELVGQEHCDQCHDKGQPCHRCGTEPPDPGDVE